MCTDAAVVLSHAVDYVDQMRADLEGSAVHLLASPHRASGAARDEARVRRDVANNLAALAEYLRTARTQAVLG
ncbi:hypothetical protein [Thalassiella azotivora]